MKRFVALFVPMISTVLFAQAQAVPNICDTTGAAYKVTTIDATTIPAPPPGMATLVLIRDPRTVANAANGTYRNPSDQPWNPGYLQFGMDGQWISAANDFSHTILYESPGDHHFCVTDTKRNLDDNRFAHRDLPTSKPVQSHYGLHMEAGKTYFLSVRPVSFEVLELIQLNEDEGLYLVSISRQGSFTKK